MRPPGKTSAPPAKAMPAARSTISSSGGPRGRSRTSTRVAAGIGSSLIARRLGQPGTKQNGEAKKKAAGDLPTARFQSSSEKLHAVDGLVRFGGISRIDVGIVDRLFAPLAF